VLKQRSDFSVTVGNTYSWKIEASSGVEFSTKRGVAVWSTHFFASKLIPGNFQARPKSSAYHCSASSLMKYGVHQDFVQNTSMSQYSS
jgi:hypothetical protein